MADAERFAAAADIDPRQVAARVLGNPARLACQVTVNETIAMALAIQRFEEIAVEADLLAFAIYQPPNVLAGCDAERAGMIALQAGHVSELIAATLPAISTEKETNDGSSHS